MQAANCSNHIQIYELRPKDYKNGLTCFLGTQGFPHVKEWSPIHVFSTILQRHSPQRSIANGYYTQKCKPTHVYGTRRRHDDLRPQQAGACVVFVFVKFVNRKMLGLEVKFTLCMFLPVRYVISRGELRDPDLNCSLKHNKFH